MKKVGGRALLDVVKDLKKELMNYCVAHAEMIEADEARHSIPSTQLLLRYNDAASRFQQAKQRLKKHVPDGLTIRELLVEFSSILKEAYDDTPDV